MGNYCSCIRGNVNNGNIDTINERERLISIIN